MKALCLRPGFFTGFLGRLHRAEMPARAAAFILTLLLAGLFALPAAGADFEYEGEIKPRDSVSHILAYYVNEFAPEELFLSIDEPPDASGRFRDLFMDLTGVLIGGVRVDKLVFRMNDAQFNPSAEWETGNVECRDALQIYAYCLLKEEDVNRHLAAKTFGEDDHWSNISMNISPAGLYAQGTYSAKVLFVTLDILIEVESGLKIVENKTIWLEDYKVRVNRLDVPDFITRKAVEQIQPLLDLGRFPLPLKLHSVILEEGQAAFSTRVPPAPLQGGITYQYRAQRLAGPDVEPDGNSEGEPETEDEKEEPETPLILTTRVPRAD